MFYPPEGLCGAEPERGPIFFTLHFIGVGRGTGGFKFTDGFLPFGKLENVLFPVKSVVYVVFSKRIFINIFL